MEILMKRLVVAALPGLELAGNQLLPCSLDLVRGF